MARAPRPVSVRAAPLAAALLLAACGQASPDALKVAVIGEGALPASPAAPVPGLAGLLLHAATVEGLVGLDAEGKVIPGLADRWIVTDDGLSYIFRLRGATWPDGTPRSAESVRVALRQAMAAAQDGSLGPDISAIDDVRAMAGRVVEIRLARPLPDTLLLLAQPELGLAHRGKGDGPLALKRAGDAALLTPVPPEKRGMPAVEGWQDTVRPLRLTVAPTQAAVSAFAAGRVDVVLGGSFNDTPALAGYGRLARLTQAVRRDPVAGLFGLVVQHPHGFTAVAQNREAIAMAIDRESLAAELGVNGWNASTRIVSANVDGDGGQVGERWADMDMDGRRALIRQRIAQWRGGSGPAPTLSVALPTGPGADLLFNRLAIDLAEVGVTLTRVGPRAAADLVLVDKVARYPRSQWFFNQLSCAVQADSCVPAADALAQRAASAPDPASASALAAQAENTLAQANFYIPFGAPIRWSLVRNDLVGFQPNRQGWHPLAPLTARAR